MSTPEQAISELRARHDVPAVHIFNSEVEGWTVFGLFRDAPVSAQGATITDAIRALDKRISGGAN